MSVTTKQIENKNFIGSEVSTPDGKGEVTGADSRYVHVKLASKKVGSFTHGEVTLLEKLKGDPK